MKYADVVVENKSSSIDSFFTYRIPDPEISVGSHVTVEFGTKQKEGYVFGLSDETDFEESKLKDILSYDCESSLNEEMIKTAVWMKRRFAIRYFDAVNLFQAPLNPRKRGFSQIPYSDIDPKYVKPKNLTEEQSEAFERINQSIEARKNEIFLIHGVTSSGKTEVYMKVIEACLNKGMTAVMLVPEISLTGQVIERFAGRFGKENIAVLHSKLTLRERSDEWMRIRKGEARIVIGARMGVFAPLSNIGCIIMDEEHEATYKADMTPKYDTLEVAAKRVQNSDGILILGSATPSVTSYKRAKEGIYTLIELKKRYNNTPLPKVDIVDMREELKNGNVSIFSQRLAMEIDTALKSGEQIILLQNRRGYSNFISCRKCGNVMKCPSCKISLTYHKASNSMVCHYCGRRYPVPVSCPSCKSKYIKYFGIGTEQVEEAIHNLYPLIAVERLDIDAITVRDELDKILERFGKGETRILVGTQLVAKGLDFSNVGLVGVISADTILNIPDYRSEERTFQLVTQVAGRAGRGDKQGKVIIQTYEPSNYAFTASLNHDFKAFYDEEDKVRRFMDYPPYGDLIMINFTSEDEQSVIETAEEMVEYLKGQLPREYHNRIMAPKVSLGFKGKDSFRQYVLIKSPTGKRNEYVYIIETFVSQKNKSKNPVIINIDINPYSIF